MVSKRVFAVFAGCFLILTCNMNRSQAQRVWKDYLVTGSFMLISGMIDGTVESLNYHYRDGFKNRIPMANNQFWNPRQSWKNKYRNGDPSQGEKFSGSTDLLICTTDGYHALHTAKQVLDVSTLVYYMGNSSCSKTKRKNNWKNIATDFIVLSAIRSIGFHLTYSLIFMPNQSIVNNRGN